MTSYWQAMGSRPVKAFGMNFRLSPNSIFPSYRKLRLPQGDYTSDIVRYGDFVQMHSLCKYVSELSESPIIIDVGAHHGAYAVILGKIAQQGEGRVIALEPNPESFTVLLENVKLNNLENTVICEQVAVSDKSGFVGIISHDSQSRISTKQNSGTIEVTTLEKLIDKYGIEDIDLLIIDVEGAELPVLQGFPWKSKRPPGKIFCELHPYAWEVFGYNGEDLGQFLEEFQYRCFDMYLHEHTFFGKESYIGPCIFVPI
jgi:FkbM family methyltransferase